MNEYYCKHCDLEFSEDELNESIIGHVLSLECPECFEPVQSINT